MLTLLVLTAYLTGSAIFLDVLFREEPNLNNPDSFNKKGFSLRRLLSKTEQ